MSRTIPPLLLLFALGLACGDDSTSPDAGGPLTAVMQCEQAAAAYAALCTSDGNRTCHVAAYQTYCANAQEPAAAAQALDCLRAESRSDSCRTFSDPSGAAACVDQALTPVSRQAWSQLANDYLALCSSAPAGPSRFEPPFALLSSAQLAEVTSCVSGAADCSSADACLAAGPQSAIAACYP